MRAHVCVGGHPQCTWGAVLSYPHMAFPSRSPGIRAVFRTRHAPVSSPFPGFITLPAALKVATYPILSGGLLHWGTQCHWYLQRAPCVLGTTEPWVYREDSCIPQERDTTCLVQSRGASPPWGGDPVCMCVGGRDGDVRTPGPIMPGGVGRSLPGFGGSRPQARLPSMWLVTPRLGAPFSCACCSLGAWPSCSTARGPGCGRHTAATLAPAL